MDKLSYCSGCVCSVCKNPDCIYSFCSMSPVQACFKSVCVCFETQGHYYYDDIGSEYWIGEDNRRHYTRDEG